MMLVFSKGGKSVKKGRGGKIVGLDNWLENCFVRKIPF